MAFDFIKDQTDRRVQLSQTAPTDNLQPATFAALINMHSALAGVERIVQKGAGGNRHILMPETISTVPSFAAVRGRASSACQAAAAFANFAAFGARKWMLLVGQTDTTTAGNNKLFLGDAVTPAAEPSAYSTQTAGGGGVTSNAGQPFQIGNQTDNDFSFNGAIAWAGITGALLTEAQIHELQRILFTGRPTDAIRIAGVTWVHDVRVGYEGTGRVLDFSDNHSPVNYGTGFFHGTRTVDDPPFLFTRRRLAKAPAAAGGLSIPIAAMHYRKLMGAM